MTVHEYLYRCRFRSFVDFAFRELHPDELFCDNWHIGLLAEMLQFSSLGKEESFSRLIFNLPPRSLKTHICSVSFPAWVLGRDPRKSVLILSETPEQAWQLQERCAELMGTSRYRSIFPRAKIKGVGKSVELAYGGGIRHAGFSYSSPHKKSDIVILDDPQSVHSLERANPSSYAEIARLLRRPKEGIMVLATRRIGAGDLSEVLCRRHGWFCLAIPGVALRGNEIVFPPDVRYSTRVGEPLNDAVEEWDDIERQLREFGADAFCHQYLQSQLDPAHTGGAETYDAGDGTRGILFVKADPERWVAERLKELRAAYTSNSVSKT